jgi:predicted O-methyltransferase YrrM
MRAGSTLTSVDIEPEYQRMARKAFSQAGFAQNQARLILGRALDVLPRLSDGTYDLVFCDADPREAADYLPAALRLLRIGGIVAFNNALLAGAPDDDADDLDDLAGTGLAGTGLAGTGLAGSGGTASDEIFDGEASGDEGPDGAEPGNTALDLAGQVRADSRLVPMLLPLGEGLLAAVKRQE